MAGSPKVTTQNGSFLLVIIIYSRKNRFPGPYPAIASPLDVFPFFTTTDRKQSSPQSNIKFYNKTNNYLFFLGGSVPPPFIRTRTPVIVTASAAEGTHSRSLHPSSLSLPEMLSLQHLPFPAPRIATTDTTNLYTQDPIPSSQSTSSQSRGPVLLLSSTELGEYHLKNH